MCFPPLHDYSKWQKSYCKLWLLHWLSAYRLDKEDWSSWRKRKKPETLVIPYVFTHMTQQYWPCKHVHWYSEHTQTRKNSTRCPSLCFCCSSIPCQTTRTTSSSGSLTHTHTCTVSSGSGRDLIVDMRKGCGAEGWLSTPALLSQGRQTLMLDLQ